MWLAIGAALLSAAFFAASSAVQHRVTGRESERHQSALQLFARLAHEPRWWLGLGMSAVAFALHAFALDRGMLALVQPIIVSGLVFGVFARAALERRLPSRETIAWCTVTWVGLAVFILVVHASSPASPKESHAAWFVAVAVAAVVGVVVAAHRAQVPELRGALFGAGAGVLFGLVAGLVKVVLAQETSRWWLLVTHWPFWALVVVGVGAILLNQRAFQATRLSVTMPIVNIVNVMVALAFGFAVFSERLFSSTSTVMVELVGLVVMAIGVRQLASRDSDLEEAPAEMSDKAGTRS